MAEAGWKPIDHPAAGGSNVARVYTNRQTIMGFQHQNMGAFLPYLAPIPRLVYLKPAAQQGIFNVPSPPFRGTLITDYMDYHRLRGKNQPLCPGKFAEFIWQIRCINGYADTTLAAHHGMFMHWCLDRVQFVDGFMATNAISPFAQHQATALKFLHYVVNNTQTHKRTACNHLLKYRISIHPLLRAFRQYR